MNRCWLASAVLMLGAWPGLHGADLISTDLDTCTLEFLQVAPRIEHERLELIAAADERAESVELRTFLTALRTPENDHASFLEQLATRKGVSPKLFNDPAAATAVDRLNLLRGLRFEKGWFVEFINAYQQVVDATRGALHSSDPEVRAAAAKVLPRYEAYLAHARKIAGSSPIDTNP